MENKNKLPIWTKLLIAVGCVAVLFATVFLIKDTYLVTKYRLFMKRTINNMLNTSERYENEEGRIIESKDFAKIEKEVPFKIEKPQWLPEGYELDYVEIIHFENGAYNVKYKFIKEKDQYIGFLIMTDMVLNKRTMHVEFEEIVINDMNIVITEYKDITSSANYMNDQGFAVSIGGTIDKETLIKIIENMG